MNIDFSKESVTECFDYLTNTDLEYAKLKSEIAALKLRLREEEDNIYLVAKGTAAERAAKSRTTDKYKDLLNQLYVANNRYNIISSERFTRVTYIKYNTYGNMCGQNKIS